ncbi:MAG TPA: CBS domain-containing protein [Longimicrobiales bacterium]
MRALDIMTPNPRVVTPGETVRVVAALMRDHDVGMVPVVGDRATMRVVGVITDRDITVRGVAGGMAADCPAQEIMSHDVLHRVEPDDEIEAVLNLMRLEKVRRVLVVAANGRLLGLIAQADLLLHAGPEHPVAVERVLAAISEPAVLHG